MLPFIFSIVVAGGAKLKNLPAHAMAGSVVWCVLAYFTLYGGLTNEQLITHADRSPAFTWLLFVNCVIVCAEVITACLIAYWVRKWMAARKLTKQS